MKITSCLVFALFLALFALPAARYSVRPVSPVLAQNLPIAGTSTAVSVLIEAHQLLNIYGNRPYWPGKPFQAGESVPTDQAPDVIAHLIPCESQDVSVKHLDSNDRYSYGVLQIQSSTWDPFEARSRITGSPMNSVTAVRMGIWAVENGQLDQWSCAQILHLAD